MLTKFESKSNRVKGLSFHPSRPWVLVSLHNGIIQLWDYRMGTLVDRFDEHDGPVRGVDFHRMQPLFVSGGDDYKIKVWDYKLRRCLFTLLGHLDYIRTVQFHHEYPWILSSSDDQTIRIWNWQGRSCVSVLTGHNHYVMCAQFHPTEDMVVSASLDQTVRVWDITGLRKKKVRGAPPRQEENLQARLNSDIFGGTDAVVKYVLEGHDRGVNWAAFHPTLPLIVSGADDRQVKLWRMNETKAWEVDTLRGHTHNISCVLFHPRQELIISNSEDRSIRVWDISKRMGIQTFRRENDRFWVVVAHPTQNLLAAGHDSGMLVFKLERERPAYDVVGNTVFYCKDRYLREMDINSGRDVPIVALRRSNNHSSGIGGGPYSLLYNTFSQTEHSVLITWKSDGGMYELISFAKDGGSSDVQDSKRGVGHFAVFVARNRFAVLGSDKQITVKNMNNEVTKKIQPPGGSADAMYPGGVAGRLLLRIDDKMVLFENQSRRVLGEVQLHRVKYVVWSNDGKFVSMMGRHGITLANKQLEILATFSETSRVKGGVWTGKGVFVYTTLSHVKYCLPSGDTGIIRTLDVPVYLTGVEGNALHCIDRDGKARTLLIDMTECTFKQALHKRQYGEVMRMIRHSRLCGQAIIAYLQEKGFPEVALHFVNDDKTRFQLALACGNLEVALNTAYELDDDGDCWHQLAVEALRQGNQQVVEMAYQKTKDFDRLSFLYLLTGNTDKLFKMLKISEMRKDVMSRFHNALFLGDVETRVQILQEVGQLYLAFLLAESHGLSEKASELREALQADEGKEINPADIAGAKLLLPPCPIMKEDNWPLLDVPGGAFGQAAIPEEAEAEKSRPQTGNGPTSDVPGEAWQDDLDLGDEHAGLDEAVEAGGGEWGLEDDLDLGEEEDAGDDGFSMAAAEEAALSDHFSFAPTPGQTAQQRWVQSSSLAADHIAAGSFESAMQLLNRQIGVVNFPPLKPYFMSLYRGTAAYVPSTGSSPSLRTFLQREPETEGLPFISLSLSDLGDRLRLAFKCFTAGKFSGCTSNLQHILKCIPLVVASSRAEVNDIRDMLSSCREYLLAIRVKQAIVPTNDAARNVELGAYFTHCNLQPAHLLLALRLAMLTAFKAKDFIVAASFARRLLELPDVSAEKNADLQLKTRKILVKSEAEARNEHHLKYDPMSPFTLCCASLSPIYRGADMSRCPYCAACYQPSFKGQVCHICELSKIGEETLGLVSSSSNRS